MSIEEYCKTVDWNRVHKKHVKMEEVKNNLKQIIVVIIPCIFMLYTELFDKLIHQLEKMGLNYIQVNNIHTLIKITTGLYILLGGICIYQYIKWSKYNIMLEDEQIQGGA